MQESGDADSDAQRVWHPLNGTALLVAVTQDESRRWGVDDTCSSFPTKVARLALTIELLLCQRINVDYNCPELPPLLRNMSRLPRCLKDLITCDHAGSCRDRSLAGMRT